MGRDAILGLGLVLVSMIAAFLFAQQTVKAMGGVSNTSYTAETFTPTNGTISTTGGYTYEYNLTSTEKTYRWVGLWGNITGTIQLQDSSSNSFYSWTVSPITVDSVLYAITDATGIDVSTFNYTNTTYLGQADTAYGYDSAVTDSITNTYTGASQFQSPSMGSAVDANSTTVESWTNYMLRIGADDIASEDEVIWAVEANPGQSAFNGELADFQLLIPENEESGDGEGTSTTYYLWVELN